MNRQCLHQLRRRTPHQDDVDEQMIVLDHLLEGMGGDSDSLRQHKIGENQKRKCRWYLVRLGQDGGDVKGSQTRLPLMWYLEGVQLADE